MVNDVRKQLEEKIQNTRSELIRKEQEKNIAQEAIDVTMPELYCVQGKTSTNSGA